MHCLYNWPPDGTTCTACKCGQQFVLLAPPGGTTCIDYKLSHQMAQHALATRWRCLHYLQVWLPDGATCIATLPMIALLTSSVGIELLSSSARVTSVKSQQHVLDDSCHEPDP